MIDILLILFTLALFTLGQIMRRLLAVRIPAELRLKPTKLKQAPDIMADLFAQTDQPLRDLGFSRGYWASVHTTPALPGITAPLMRLYHHKDKPVIARVSPPHTIFSTDRCQVTFLSISKRKTFLVTSDGAPDLFPRPSEDRSIILITRGVSVAEQFSAHVGELSQRELKWLDRSEQRGEATWLFRLANRYEAKRIQWLNDNQYVKQLVDSSSVPRIGIVLDFIRRLATGLERILPQERSAIPLNRAAYLFQNWQQASSLPPPISAQLGFFISSTLASVLLAGLLWDWTIALLLPVGIGLHEAGHWLTLRILGYRNLQLQMLPLVGGISLNHENWHKATHPILFSLMGPLPGIILGTIILLFNGMVGDLVSKLGITLLVFNYLSLLPIMPLDGGQLLKALVSSRRLSVLITLEWLGSVALLLLGWLSDSIFLLTLALLPFFSGLALIKRRRVLESLEGVADGVEQPSRYKRIAAVIQAIDQTDKSYRPLKKKVREIGEVLTILEHKPTTHIVTRSFLALYLVIVVLPPAVVYSASPGMEHIILGLFSNTETNQQITQEKSISFSMSQLVMELADRHRNISDPYRSQRERVIIRPPVTHESVTNAEMRLGIQLDEVHLEFLETSNGFINQLSSPDGTDYLVYPVEEVVRFAQKLPGIVNRFRSEVSSNTRYLARIKVAFDSIEVKSEMFSLNQLAPMLVIGNPHAGNYLLLDMVSHSDTPHLLYEVFETPSGLEGRRFKSLRHYLTNHLSMIQASNLSQGSSD